MLKGIQVPSEWAEVLQDVHAAGCKGAIIHGGALRDLVLGKIHRVKDIDVAIPAVSDESLDRDGWDHGFMPKPAQASYSQIPRLLRVDNWGTHFVHQPVQTSVYDYPLNWFGRRIINDNDFGINQICWDGQKFLYTPAFEHDVQTKTFTALKFKVRRQAENSIKRAKKWKHSGDYKGFTFDVSRADQFLKDNPNVIVTTLEDGDDFLF